MNSPSGQQWTRNGPQLGRRSVRNMIRIQPGLTPYAAGRIHDKESALRLIFDTSMLETIVVESNKFAANKPMRHWRPLDEEEIRLFFGLCILRGVYRGNGENMEELWSEAHGRPIFKQVMSLTRFQEIQCALRFDNPETRQARLRNDKLAAVRLLLDGLASNSQRCYNPGLSGVTVDEQLYPYRGRCRFIQYIKTKPAKYGLKSWCLNDCETAYCWNIIMYTGKGEEREGPLGEHVVLSLAKNLYNTGLNVTSDNFFTSLQLANKLLEQNLTLLGTIRAHRREIPFAFRSFKERTLYSSEFLYTTEKNIQLVSYKCKKNKVVLVLSSQHQSTAVSDCPKKTPVSIQDYNATKVGTDVMDQMISYYTVKFKTKRWPVVVFCNVLDIACINAFILYKACFPNYNTGKLDKRRLFLIDLGMALVQRRPPTAIQNLNPNPATRGRCHLCPRDVDQKQRTKCAKCQRFCCKNHTNTLCSAC